MHVPRPYISPSGSLTIPCCVTTALLSNQMGITWLLSSEQALFRYKLNLVKDNEVYSIGLHIKLKFPPGDIALQSRTGHVLVSCSIISHVVISYIRHLVV